MKTAELSDIRDRVAALAKASAVGRRVRDVLVEANEDEEAGDFLRVLIELDDLEQVKVEEVEPLIRLIEDVVGQLDDRYPSVRFAEAA
jgi:hypothetical protein